MARPGIEPGPLTYESGAIPTALRGPASSSRDYTRTMTTSISLTPFNDYLGPHDEIYFV